MSKSRSLADTVYQELLSRIVAGTYPENTKLPTEAELAEDLGASRPVVRAAIARLRESDLVASRRGSGSFVLKRPNEAAAHFAPIESIADIQRYFEYRIMLEGEAAYLAAERASDRDIEKMTVEVKRMDEALETNEDVVEGDFRFHLAICEATDNYFLVSSFQFLADAMHQSMNLAHNLTLRGKRSRQAVVHQEHHRIFLAIRNRERNAARVHMQMHLRNARHRIFKGPSS
ncbi:FadR/GntR family transcriptional regulator [Cohaesibacter sp. ES.047]|uniref:FadR/GntR family transcriptional regulator n=1 Tax=Cohaesibacter sp. ES.047 TaxID=1798205 RepID=UPI0015611730|nr:FadR/GntR family transcriptional regulator [Cohaesibacter sp. ES.047]